jgi:hypothetical protein
LLPNEPHGVPICALQGLASDFNPALFGDNAPLVCVVGRDSIATGIVADEAPVGGNCLSVDRRIVGETIGDADEGFSDPPAKRLIDAVVRGPGVTGEESDEARRVVRVKIPPLGRGPGIVAERTGFDVRGVNGGRIPGQRGGVKAGQ